MPPTTRSQAAAAARHRDLLEARRGVLTRRHVRTLGENVAPPAEAMPSSRRNSRAAAVVGRPQEEIVNKAARGNSKTTAGGRWHISSLCDDLLLEIFLHLPSVATLVRATCACAAWRCAVASSPDFRRRFRTLHAPPLLSLVTGGSIVAGSPAAFVPACPVGRDVDAAVRGGDFLLTSLEAPAAGWKVLSNICRLGNVLLHNPDLGTKRNMLGGYFVGALLSSEDEAGLLMLVDHAGSKMKATIYSMDTGVCSAATPWVDVPAYPDQDGDHVSHGTAVHLSGSVYCVLRNNWGYTVSIDTATMEFTVIELPQCVSRKSKGVGGTGDHGATCLVYSDGLDVGVLMHMRDDGDGIQKWVLDRVVSMDAELQRVLPAGHQVCVLLSLGSQGWLRVSVNIGNSTKSLLVTTVPVLRNDEAGEAVSGDLWV